MAWKGHVLPAKTNYADSKSFAYLCGTWLKTDHNIGVPPVGKYANNLTLFILYQTFGNIYTIEPFGKHAIACLILLAHAQTNFPPVLHTNILAPFKGNNLNASQKAFNRNMSHVRVSVEWGALERYHTFLLTWTLKRI